MRDISLKSDNSGDTLPAGDFNANLRSELQNAVESAGFTLDAEGGPDTDLNMLGKTLATYASGATYYSDSGAANAYVLSRIGDIKNVSAYFDGMLILFKPGNDNTGACTVNVNSLGSVDLKHPGGTALSGGELRTTGYVVARYNSSSACFDLLFSGILQLPAPTLAGAYKNIQVKADGSGFDLIGPLHDFRNKFINGNFDFWQRGISAAGLSSGSTYLADRWRHYVDGTTLPTVDASQETFTIGQEDVPGNPTYFHRSTVTTGSAADEQVLFIQNIEGVATFSGDTATISFWAKADAAKDIAIELRQYFGSGGSTAVNSIGVTTVSLTTSWAKYSVTVNVPSISGSTVDAGSLLQISWWLSAGSDFDSRTNSLGNQDIVFDISRVQIEYGNVATVFNERPLDTELSLCRRYFEKSWELGTDVGTATVDNAVQFRYEGAAAGVYLAITFEWSTPKRDTPAITLYSIDSGASGYVYSASDGDIAVSNVARVGTERGGYIVTSTNISLTSIVSFHFTVDAEL